MNKVIKKNDESMKLTQIALNELELMVSDCHEEDDDDEKGDALNDIPEEAKAFLMATTNDVKDLFTAQTELRQTAELLNLINTFRPMDLENDAQASNVWQVIDDCT